jgi:hypothetical protein
LAVARDGVLHVVGKPASDDALRISSSGHNLLYSMVLASNNNQFMIEETPVHLLGTRVETCGIETRENCYARFLRVLGRIYQF